MWTEPRECHLSVFTLDAFVFHVTGKEKKNHDQIQRHETLPLFSSRSCIVLSLRFRDLIQFQLILACGIQ